MAINVGLVAFTFRALCFSFIQTDQLGYNDFMVYLEYQMMVFAKGLQPLRSFIVEFGFHIASAC